MTKGGERERLAVNIGKTKKMLEAGYSITEIAVKLGTQESIIRKWVSMIEETKSKEAAE